MKRRRAATSADSFNWQVSSKEKAANKDALIAANRYASFDTETYFKVSERIQTSASIGRGRRLMILFAQVHWTRVLDLIEKRKVFMKAGTAWVPMREQASLIVAEFSNRLMKDLEVCIFDSIISVLFLTVLLSSDNTDDSKSITSSR
jgi:DNA primase large subunit